jgi:hypothetical protein
VDIKKMHESGQNTLFLVVLGLTGPRAPAQELSLGLIQFSRNFRCLLENMILVIIFGAESADIESLH